MKNICILFVILLVACTSKEQKAQDVQAPPPAEPAVVNERPTMAFRMLDGSQVDARTVEEKMVLILFQPDCDHCQAEAKQISSRLDAFKDYTLYFISSEPLEVIDKFAKDYHLDNKPNVRFGSTTVESVLDNYGAIQAPSVYIYTKEGRLVEGFEGQVDVEMIIRHL